MKSQVLLTVSSVLSATGEKTGKNFPSAGIDFFTLNGYILQWWAARLPPGNGKTKRTWL